MDRYLITTEMYIYADSDKKAKSLAGYIQGKQRKDYDNQCHVLKLESAPFGRLGSDTNLIEGEIL
tara:strand:- start:204 stop:398 length:195 start_codon:yes stop_codon:yes gene_type:complete